jgi:hypothetical protein
MLAAHLMGKGRKSKPKPKTVNLGKKGAFKIKKPGAFRRKAQKAGLTTRVAAQRWKGRPGEKGSQARSAIGLMSMHHKG